MNDNYDRIRSTEGITHADSAKFPKVVAIQPKTKAELDVIHNRLKLKYAMLGAMLWDSIMAMYQLDLIGD